MADLSQQQLEAAHCWEATDRVPGRPAMTEFRRRLRYHQAEWRESKGYPIGTHPIVPRATARRCGCSGVGSRSISRTKRARPFVTPNALRAARTRTSYIERHQSVDHQRLWADLLWAPALAFNLFGDVAADLALADRVVHTWWPDVPGTVCDVRFAHSPGKARLVMAREPQRLRGGVRARPRRRDERDRRRADPVSRPDQARGPEADPTRPLPGHHSEVRPVHTGRDRRRERHQADGDVAQPPPRTVDAAARERSVDLGPRHRDPPRGEHRPRRGLRAVRRSARRPIDLLVDDPRVRPRVGALPKRSVTALRERYLARAS